MSSRKTVKKSSPNVEVKLSNWLAQVCAMIMTRFCYLILGRASSKTTEFLVERLIEMVYDMPGAPVCWVSDTYSNLQKNVLPSVMEGLKRKGFIEGVHYVLEKRPPEYTVAEKSNLPKWLRDNFWKPYNSLASYKHTMLFFTGLNIRFGSLDRPASLAGPSYVHVFGDEVKYFREDRISNLLKAVRGYFERYGHSVFYRGHTFTTDMPDTSRIGEYDWILKRGANMDPQAIEKVLQVGMVVNECAGELAAAQESGNKAEIVSKQRVYEKWLYTWTQLRLRKEAHRFFFIASSYINVSYLNLDWFSDAILDKFGDLKAAVLGIKPSLSSGDRFYANLQEKHFYRNGSDPRYHDSFGLLDKEDCRILSRLKKDEKLEAGMDFGNMMSMTIGQPGKANKYNVLKFMHTLSPMWIREFADEFVRYWEPHKEKVLELYYDRAGNNYAKAGQDLASDLKKCIEKTLEGKSTGWKVILMSKGQGNIGVHEEYNFMMQLFSGANSKLPDIEIDFFNCKELRASIQDAKTYKNKKGQIEKDKKSEKLPIHRLPMESTNPSDSFKYLMMRRNWRLLVKATGTSYVGNTGTY